jgi:hypothetical protein
MTTWEQVPKRKTNNFLTPAQFETWKRAQNKPHATYGGYTSWVKSTRAARDNARLAADPYGQNAALSQFRAGLLTPAQQAAQAQSMINAKIKGALGQIEDTYSGARSDTADAAKRAQGYMQAFANMTATTPDQVASVYNDAADRLKGWGTGLTGAFQQAEESENAKAAAALAATGTKTSIPVNDFDPAAMRNVLQYTGVVTPGKNLQEEAANAAAMARFQRAAGASQVESVAQDYLEKGRALDKEMAGKKAALLATEPDLYQQALSGLQTQGQQGWSTFINALQQQRATDIQSKYLENATRQAGAEITGRDPVTGLPTVAATTAATQAKLDRQKLIADQNQFIQERIDKAAGAAKPNATLSKAVGYLVDSNGNALTKKDGGLFVLPGFKLDKNGNLIKTATGKKGGAEGGATPGEIQTFLSSLKKDTYKKVTTRNPTTGTSVSRNVPGQPTYAMNFHQALKRLTTWGGVSDAQARAYLQSVYPRGAAGRAWLTNEEQNALRKWGRTVSGPGAGRAATVIRKSLLGSAYLTPQQYRALTAAGFQIPGHPGTSPAGTRIWWING